MPGVSTGVIYKWETRLNDEKSKLPDVKIVSSFLSVVCFNFQYRAQNPGPYAG